MERRKLTKEDIDKVRNIEGFPIGTDEDIIALSDAPFYTACPNPFIEDFIKEYGTPFMLMLTRITVDMQLLVTYPRWQVFWRAIITH